MSLEFLNQTPIMAFRRLEADLKMINPKIDLDRYKSMTPKKLEEQMVLLDHKARGFQTDAVYGSWLRDSKFVETKMLHEAVSLLHELKILKESKERLIPGYTYYSKVKQFGSVVEGFRCLLGESRQPQWVPFKANAAVLKAFEVIQHGGDEDFRRIYVEMADGRLDGVVKVRIEHLSESSDDALKQIEAYCDSKWDGPWPWEAKSPSKLFSKIEEREEMNKLSLTEMQGRFTDMLRRLNEGEMDKYEVISQLQGMSDKIQGMIQDLGEMLGEGMITLKDQARVSIGDDAASQIEQALTQPVSQAADMLSQLRASIEKTLQSLSGNGGDMGGDMGGDPLGGDMGGDLGTPMDAMGGEDALPDEMADVSLDGTDGERPKKVM